jgi:nucleoside-diphosphate-sugar epimerase
MKILITGHKGFIGQVLWEKLKNDHDLIGLDTNAGMDMQDCEIPDADAVIHLAGKSGVRQSFNDPGTFWNVNVNGSKRIFDHFKGKRILYASSSTAYEPYLNPYANSKRVMEEIAPENSLGMRFHTVYSNNPREGMLLWLIQNNKLNYITEHSRDFIHVDDLCDAIIVLLKTDATGIVDIGMGESYSVKELAELAGMKDLPIKPGMDSERQKTQANKRDIEILHKMGWKPKYNVKNFLTNEFISSTI